VHPDKVLTNGGARAGDQLILTKPLGTGIINTAIKRDAASPSAVDTIVASMTTLNRRAMELLADVPVHACTDVTGFGLLGHAAEMVDGAEVGFEIDAAAVPLFASAVEYGAAGHKPGGIGRNRKHFECKVQLSSEVPAEVVDVLYDPQTSGGLLVAVPGDVAPTVAERMRLEGVPDAAIVGRVTDLSPGKIVAQ
jgi:selenide,water dikinase